MDYYSRKHKEEYKQLIESYGVPEKYWSDAGAVKDFFDAFRLYGMPAKYYFELDFYNLKSKEERNDFVPPGRLVSIWKGVNNGPSRKTLDDKATFMKSFSKYINRDWLYVPDASFDEFFQFIKKHSAIMAKKNTGAGGFGISRFNNAIKTDEELKALYEEYIKEDILLEEEISQSGILHDINPSSVNCVRVCTLRVKDKVEVFQCFLKIGAPGACVDNIRQGGAFATINPETGVVNSVSYGELCSDKKKELLSGIDVLGMEIPYWKEVKNLVTEASVFVKDMLYVSWDVAIDESGKLYLIEGNTCGNTMWLKRGGEWQKIRKALIKSHKYLRFLLTYNIVLKLHTKELLEYSDL